MAEAVMGRRERKKLQSKKTILAAAVEQFTAKGVRETSIADIMGAAELGIGTFYNYFESKEALLLCLLGKIADETRMVAAERMKSEAPAAETLEEILIKTAEKLEENRFVMPLFLRASDRSALPRARQAPEPRLAPAFHLIFSELVEYGQRRREFRRDIPAEVVTELLHSIFQSAAFSSLETSFTENVRIKTDILLSGLVQR